MTRSFRAAWRALLAAFVGAAVIGAFSAFAAPIPSDRLVQLTLPGTNTPTEPPLFATNTPPPSPTATPSVTPTLTPSLTPTATNTPTLTPSLTNTPTLTPSPTATLVGPFSYPDGFNPLTGLPYPDAEAAARRNLLVKVSNYPPVVRPQYGVNRADVVYEYEVEGGVTRFAAIYRSDSPDRVGPVRSGRLTDLELVPMYESLFAYSGASGPVQESFRAQTWRRWIFSPSVGDDCADAGFCRIPNGDVAFEHTLFLDTGILWDKATARGVNTGFRARGFAFSDRADAGGEPITDIAVDYYGQTDARWQYRAAEGRYVRYTDDLPHFDAGDGDQLWADNLIIIEVPHEDRPDLFEPESRTASHQINLWGQGTAYVFRDGRFYQGFWRRLCRGETPDPQLPEGREDECPALLGDALQVIYGDNTPILLKPGRTWVMITRWMNYVGISTQQPNLEATATVIAQTPTVTPFPTRAG